MGDDTPLTLQWARYYTGLGWSVIPIRAGEKVPLVPWEKYQKERPTDEDLSKWFSRGGSNLAIVTGQVSGIVVVDVDTDIGALSLEPYISTQIETPSVKTPKGRHLYFKHPGGFVLSNHARRLDGCDFRGDGGYVVAPPSSNGHGTQYRWEATPKDFPIVQLPIQYIDQVLSSPHPTPPNNLLDLSNCNAHANHANSEYYGMQGRDIALHSVTKRDISFLEGSRDDSLFSVAWHLEKAGMDGDSIFKVLETIAKSWGESTSDPKIDKWLRDKVASALKREKRVFDSLADTIQEFFSVTSGYISVTECDKELGIVTLRDKNNRRQVFRRLVEAGIIERTGSKAGHYRRIEKDSTRLDWESADCSAIYQIKWLFEIEKLVNLYPKNIAIVAGSSNSGKTALLLNLAHLNASDHPVRYFSSEMGPEELKLRLSNFEDVGQEEWRGIEFFDRSTSFAHAIEPDSLNIIDYLELSDNFFAVGGEIREIFDRLNKGIAVIALQKKAGSELGRGAEFTLEKARLYLSMDKGKIKIVKAKNWAQKGRNPNGKEWEFKLVNGSKFVSSSSNVISEIEF